MTLLSLLKSPVAWSVAAVLATAIAIAVIYRKGETAGAASVTTAVEHTANVELEKARKDKDAADEKVRTSPADAVIDSTR
jgi:hypothetical protein